MSWDIVVLLSLVEGLTEFLPISSTGHLILVSSVFGLNEDLFIKQFNVIIQFGAILSVLFVYRSRFIEALTKKRRLYGMLVVAFFPAAVVGLALKDRIDQILGSVVVVAIALILGGVVLVASDRPRWSYRIKDQKIDDLRWKDGFWIGWIQCLAFIPGVSRAAATIFGGLWVGLSKKEATEFSFFLAVPTLTGAAFLKTIKLLPTITSSQVPVLVSGIVLSFIFAWMAIRLFIALIQKYGFRHFGYYRIVLGALVLLFHWRN